MESIKYDQKFIKEQRQYIQDGIGALQAISAQNDYRSRELSLAITKLEEAKMWLGKDLGNNGGEDLNAKRDAEELKG